MAARQNSARHPLAPKLPKEKLTVKIADVDCVHINDVNVSKTGQCEVRQNLTP